MDNIEHNIERVEQAFNEMRLALAGARQRFSEGSTLTRTQLEIISQLIDGPRTTSELAKALFLTQSAVTQTVDTLVRQALVARIPDAGDRRVTRLELSAEGKRVTNHLRGLKRKKMEEIMVKLTADEVEAMISITRKFTEVFNETKRSNLR